MSETTITVTVCRACLQPELIDENGLCENCTDIHEDHLTELLALLGDSNGEV